MPTRAEALFLAQRTEMRQQLAVELESLRAAMVESPEEMMLAELQVRLEDMIRHYVGKDWLNAPETQASLELIYAHYADLKTAEERLAALEGLSRTLGAAPIPGLPARATRFARLGAFARAMRFSRRVPVGH